MLAELLTNSSNLNVEYGEEEMERNDAEETLTDAKPICEMLASEEISKI